MLLPNFPNPAGSLMPVERKRALVQLAVRKQGLFTAAGNPHKVRGMAALRRQGLRFVNRPEGSGTRMLIDQLLARHGLSPREVSGYESAEFTHAAVAAYIASGMADVGIGVQTAARRFGLHFIPLVRERYFFAMNRTAHLQPPVADALRVMGSPAYRSDVAALSGYEAAQTGRVRLDKLDGLVKLMGEVVAEAFGA